MGGVDSDSITTITITAVNLFRSLRKDFGKKAPLLSIAAGRVDSFALVSYIPLP